MDGILKFITVSPLKFVIEKSPKFMMSIPIKTCKGAAVGEVKAVKSASETSIAGIRTRFGSTRSTRKVLTRLLPFAVCVLRTPTGNNPRAVTRLVQIVVCVAPVSQIATLVWAKGFRLFGKEVKTSVKIIFLIPGFCGAVFMAWIKLKVKLLSGMFECNCRYQGLHIE